MDVSRIAPALMGQVNELLYDLYAEPAVPLFYLGVCDKTSHVFVESEQLYIAEPISSMSIQGLDCDGVREQGGLVVMMEMDDGSDIDFTVSFRFDRKTRQIQPVIEKSVNTVFRSRAFEALEQGCETALRTWIWRVLGPINRPIQRCLACKEEIMMRAWHPDRVMRLLEAGIEVEDM